MLSEEQSQAVQAREGYWACLAGPGSGKTTVLVSRYQALLESGVPPQDILSLTFTKKAAEEMRKRSGQKADVPNTGRPSGFLTFHSLALSFATIERQHFPFRLADFPLATPGQVAKIASIALRRYPSGFKFREFISHISLLKRHGIRPQQALDEAVDDRRRSLALAYRDYTNYCRDSGVLDFDDLIIEMDALLQANPEVKNLWSYPFICIDEAQDTDSIQWSVLKSISAKHGNLFAVGDLCQSIYGWRGALPDIFSRFDEMFPGSKVLTLSCNYRSTKQIVEYTRQSAPIQNQLSDKLYTTNGEGVKPEITSYASTSDEAAGVQARLSGILSDNVKSTASILARTNAYLRPFEDGLSQAGVKYHLLGKSGFWQQGEIKTALAFIQCAAFPSDAAVLAALRSPYECARFIRKKELAAALGPKDVWQKLRDYRHSDPNQQRAIDGIIRVIQSLRAYHSRPAGEAVGLILRDLKASKYYEEEEELGPDNNPVENLRQLSNIATRFDSLPDFLNYARKMSGVSRKRTGVSLGTIHSAKGLEWDHVFLVGASEGQLPHNNAESLEEEARVFFVAISRAAKTLHISHTGLPSRFLRRGEIKSEPSSINQVFEW